MVTISVENVSKKYGDIIAVDDITLEFRDGEYTCIIGPSGSGKSTLLKIIAGIVKPDRGRVYFDGEDVTDLPVDLRCIGMISQDILLFPHITVWDNIIYGPTAKGYDTDIIVRAGREIIGLLGLKYNFRSYPDSLSRGSQQKVAIARALATHPKALLLDEPLGGLDVRAALDLKFEIKRLAKDLKLTTIHITHNQEEALSIADKIVIMRRGRIEQVGKPEEVYDIPSTPFVARFVGGESNFFEGVIIDESSGKLIISVKDLDLRIETPSIKGLSVNDEVLVSIKPEHIMLTKDEGVKGTVVEKDFLGAYTRLIININGKDVIVRVKKTSLNVGDTVRVLLLKAHIFPYPKEGLERAIAYE